MTTFTFVDVEVATVNANPTYINQQVLYTVPSGKIAKIKFDSVHISKSTGTGFSVHIFVMYSQGTNVIRKHVVGYADTPSSDVATLNYYNPKDWTNVQTAGGTASISTAYTMSTQPQSWIDSSNNIDTTFDDNLVGYPNYTTADNGTRVYCPETFFMKAGEVLKYSDKLENVTGGHRYTNMRLAVWLEDV
jgi:hypothetical protein